MTGPQKEAIGLGIIYGLLIAMILAMVILYFAHTYAWPPGHHFPGPNTPTPSGADWFYYLL